MESHSRNEYPPRANQKAVMLTAKAVKFLGCQVTMSFNRARSVAALIAARNL